MTQADFTIANQTFPNTRTELNTSLQALATNSAGNSAPSTTFPNQWWFDSDGNILYMRNKDNDAWVSILTIGATSDLQTITTDLISEVTSAAGVTIDSLLIKDGKIANLMNATLSAADMGVGVHIKSADSGMGSVNANADELIIEGSGSSGISILSGATSKSNLFFGDSGSNVIGNISYNHSTNELEFATNGANRMVIASTGATTITTADNSDTLSLISTDADANVGPNLNLYRNSSSPADNDTLGQLAFVGRNDNSQDFNAFQMTAYSSDVSDGTEDGTMQMYTMQNGSLHLAMQITPTETVFNDSSKDQDFRVESNGNANMLFVNGGTDRVHFGGSSGDREFNFEGADNLRVLLRTTNNSTGACQLQFGDSDNSQIGRIMYEHDGDQMTFHTSATERLKITSGGFAKFSNTGAYKVAQQFHEFTNTSGSQQVLYCRHLDSNNPYGLEVRFDASAPDDNTHWAYRFSDTGAGRFQVFSDGDVVNHDNAYGAISDERIKQDIVDANSQWNDIKAVKVRNYKKKDDVRQYGDNAWSQIGVIAQELEAVSPKLIRHSDPNPSDILSSSEFGTLYTETQDEVLYTSDDQEVIDGDKNVVDVKTPKKEIGEVKTITEQVKSVNYSILYMKAIKALQEAMTKIEDLEARVTTLEG